MKTCLTCDESKSISAYAIAKKGRLGRAARCKVCWNARARATTDYAREYARRFDQTKEYYAAYRKTKEYKAMRRRYLRQKYLKDPLHRLSVIMRSQLKHRIRETVKGKISLLNYTAEDLRAHLEARFQDGMTWENYGRQGWHVDHKIPLSFRREDGSYYWDQAELQDPFSNTFKSAWSLSNLQPMWASENLFKGNRFTF